MVNDYVLMYFADGTPVTDQRVFDSYWSTANPHHMVVMTGSEQTSIIGILWINLVA